MSIRIQYGSSWYKTYNSFVNMTELKEFLYKLGQEVVSGAGRVDITTDKIGE